MEEHAMPFTVHDHATSTMDVGGIVDVIDAHRLIGTSNVDALRANEGAMRQGGVGGIFAVTDAKIVTGRES